MYMYTNQKYYPDLVTSSKSKSLLIVKPSIVAGKPISQCMLFFKSKKVQKVINEFHRYYLLSKNPIIKL